MNKIKLNKCPCPEIIPYDNYEKAVEDMGLHDSLDIEYDHLNDVYAVRRVAYRFGYKLVLRQLSRNSARFWRSE